LTVWTVMKATLWIGWSLVAIRYAWPKLRWSQIWFILWGVSLMSSVVEQASRRPGFASVACAMIFGLWSYDIWHSEPTDDPEGH
jgi:hypothetical protein